MDKFKLIFIIVLVGLLTGGVILFYEQVNTKSNFSNNSYDKERRPTPPTIKTALSSQDKKILKELFKGCNLSGDKKQLVKACDYKNSTVRNYSVNIAGQSAGDYNLGQICDIFDHFYDNWKYVNDPQTMNYVEYASVTIQNNFNGDCDDFAVLLCSALISIGGEARINYAYNSTSGHAFTEVNLGKTNKNKIINYLKKRYNISSKINGRHDKYQNWWLNLDWFANHPGGKYFDYTSGTTFYIIQNYCEKF